MKDYLEPYRRYVVGGRLKPKSNGGFIASCPQPSHKNGDKHPSLSIDKKDSGNGYIHYCHTCGDKGDSADVAEKVGLNKADYFQNPVRNSSPKTSEHTTVKVQSQPPSIKQEPQKVANGIGLINNGVTTKDDEKEFSIVDTSLVMKHHQYLMDNFHLAKQIGWLISKESARDIGLGYDTSLGSMVIPIRNDLGRCLTLKRHKKGGYFPKDNEAKNEFYDRVNKWYPQERLPNYNKNEALFIVAGEKDCENLYSASQKAPPIEEGLDLTETFDKMKESVEWHNGLVSMNIATVTGGEKSIPKEKYWTYVNGFACYVIIYDNDQAGRDGAFELAKQIRRHNPKAPIYIHQWYDQSKEGYDVSDWLKDNNNDTGKLIALVAKHQKSYEEILKEKDTEIAKRFLELFEIDGFKIIKPKEIKEDNVKPLQWFVKGLTPKGFNSILGGTTGSGKSYYCMQEGMSLATGTSFLGYEVPRKYKVLFVDTEVGEEEFNRRFLALKRKYNFDSSDLESNWLGISKIGDFADAYPTIEKVIQACSPDLVYVDNIYSSTDIDDISQNKNLKSMLTTMARLGKEYNTTIKSIGHFNKPTGNEYTFSLSKMSGGSSLGNWSGYVQLMTTTNDDNLRLIKQAKTRGTAENKSVYGLQWTYENKELENGDSLIWKAGFELRGIETNVQILLEKKEKLTRYEDILADWEEGARLSTADWLNACSQHPETMNVSERQQLRYLKDAVTVGLLKENGKEDKMKYYKRTTLKIRDWSTEVA